MKKDLQLAFHWFTHPNNTPQSFLTAEGVQILDEVQTALSTHALDTATRISLHLFYVSHLDRLEVGEVLLRTAIHAVTLIGDEYLQFAKAQILRASEIFFHQDMHCRAIALWFMGYIYWQIPSYRTEAIRYWESSRALLLVLSYAHDTPWPDWYQKILFVVAESVFQTKILHRYYPLTQVKYLRLRPTLQPSASANTKVKTPVKSIVIRSLPIYQYVPAGGWGVVEPEEVGYSEMDGLTINGVDHQAVNLRDGGQVVLQDGVTYALVRIKGTSMNRNDIQSSDYVLIRRQEDASHMDIVLAECIGTDPEATLKRLFKQGNTIELRPESDDPSNEVLHVDKRDNLRILGIAIAVLKPLPPAENGSEPSA